MTFEELHEKLQDQETLLKQDDTSRETPSITTQFHHKFSNHKGNSEKFGGHPGGNFNNKGVTTNLGNRNIFNNQKKKRLFKVIKNSLIKEITIPNSISILHNILGVSTMVPINAELFFNCDKAGHSAKVCHSRPPSHFSP